MKIEKKRKEKPAPPPFDNVLTNLIRLRNNNSSQISKVLSQSLPFLGGTGGLGQPEIRMR